MKSLLSPIIALGLSALTGCGMIDCVQGSGEVISQNRQVSPFESVTSNGSIDVVVTQGNTQSLRIEGDDNILPLIRTEVSGGTLTISTKDGSCYNSHKGITAYVTMPTVRKLTVNGSGDFSGATAINSSKLDLEINGSGSMNFNVTGAPVTASIDGSGDVTLQGSSPNFAVSINGSGDVHADRMQAEAASVEVDGSGDCALNVTHQLSVNVGGSGDVTYRGNPASVRTSIHGSGTVTKRP